MWRVLTRINRNLVLAIPAMMLAGFIYGILADAAPLKSLILPLTFLMVYPMMVTLRLRAILAGGDRSAQLLTQAINFLIIPFVAWGLGRLFFADNPYMALGLLLAGLVPTSGMTISWTGFAGGNVAAAVKMTVIGLLLGSLLTPFYLQALLGAEVAVDLLAVFRQILLVVVLPLVAGAATRELLLRRFGQEVFQKQLAPRFPGLSSLGVLGIVFIAIALKARPIAAHPEQLLRIALPLLLLYLINYALGIGVARRLLPREDGIALIYGTVMRNLSIALAVALNAFGAAGSDAALVIALAYIIQVQSAAWSVRFTCREEPAAVAA